MLQLSFADIEDRNEEIKIINSGDVDVNEYKRAVFTTYRLTNVHALATLPAGDGNWVSASKYATIDELKKAEEILLFLNEHEKGNKNRLAAVQRELKRRRKCK